MWAQVEDKLPPLVEEEEDELVSGGGAPLGTAVEPPPTAHALSWRARYRANQRGELYGWRAEQQKQLELNPTVVVAEEQGSVNPSSQP